MPFGALKMHQNALKLPLWRIARRPAAAGGRVIRQKGDFWMHFGSSGPQCQGLIVVSVRPCPPPPFFLLTPTSNSLQHQAIELFQRSNSYRFCLSIILNVEQLRDLFFLAEINRI